MFKRNIYQIEWLASGDNVQAIIIRTAVSRRTTSATSRPSQRRRVLSSNSPKRRSFPLIMWVTCHLFGFDNNHHHREHTHQHLQQRRTSTRRTWRTAWPTDSAKMTRSRWTGGPNTLPLLTLWSRLENCKIQRLSRKQIRREWQTGLRAWSTSHWWGPTCPPAGKVDRSP